MKLSAVILSKRTEKHLDRTLQSLLFCDEILVIQDGDGELNIPHPNVKVIKRKLDDFALQRNFGMHKATYDWVLFVDADEVITPELAGEITRTLKIDRNNTQAFHLRRRDFFWGKELRWGEVKKAYDRGIIRLVNRNSGNWIGRVHEVFTVSGKSGRLSSFINHYPHQTVKEFLEEVNFYSSLRAHELIKKGMRGSIVGILFLPFLKFLYTYFILAGFRDGPPGFAYAFFMSFHSFLVRAKTYQLSRKFK